VVDPFGFRGSWSGHERDVFFYNTPGRGRLFQLAYGMGLDFADDGRAIIPTDIDGDGDLDVVFSGLQNLRLLENRHPASVSNFIRIRLQAEQSKGLALGAIVRVSTGTTTQQDYVKLTAGFQSQVPTDLHFGLGEEQVVDSIEVEWPNGRKQVHSSLKANQLYLIRAGVAEVQTLNLSRWTNPPRAIKNKLLAQTAATLDGKTSQLSRGSNKPTVINFWAPWCKPCGQELPVLKSLQSKFKKKIDWIAVSVETKDLKSVRKALKRHGWKARQFLANDALLEAFFGDEGELPLPSTFVFDREGRLARAYYRPISKNPFENSLRRTLTRNESAHLLIKLGEAQFLRDQTAAAEDSFAKALEVSPNSKYALLGMAAVMRNKSDPKKAITYTKLALKVDPKFAYGRWLLGLSYSQMGDETKAVPEYRAAVKLSPNSTRYLMTLGSAEFRSKNLVGAAKSFESLLKLDPQSIKAWLNLAKVRMAMRNPAALDAVQAVLKLRPDHQEARQMEAQLKQILGQQP